MKIIYARTHILHPHLLAAWEEIKRFLFRFFVVLHNFLNSASVLPRERDISERERARACTKKESEKEPRDPDQR